LSSRLPWNFTPTDHRKWTDDFKKEVKYLDTKMKELYSYLKGKEEEDGDRGKKYYMGKK
jgi:hypothetical protein